MSWDDKNQVCLRSGCSLGRTRLESRNRGHSAATERERERENLALLSDAYM